MPALQWSEDFVLDLAPMDSTHQEFVELLATVADASDGALMHAWQHLVEHTDDHFSREDRWMVDTRFSSSNCHTMQHSIVLQVMQQGLERGREGDLSMDAALAAHLHRVGYDPVTGTIHTPQALPQGEIHGCAGDSCSDAESPTETEVVCA